MISNKKKKCSNKYENMSYFNKTLLNKRAVFTINNRNISLKYISQTCIPLTKFINK